MSTQKRTGMSTQKRTGTSTQRRTGMSALRLPRRLIDHRPANRSRLRVALDAGRVVDGQHAAVLQDDAARVAAVAADGVVDEGEAPVPVELALGVANHP